MRRRAVLATLVLLAVPAFAAEDFRPPKDGVLTEKQADGVVLVIERAVKRLKELSKEGEQRKGEMSVPEAMAIYGRVSQAQEQDLKDAGLGRREYDWASVTVQNVFLALLGERVRSDAIGQGVKETAEKTAAAQKRVDEAEARKKSGKKKWHTDDDRKAAIEAAQGDAKAADDETADAQKRVEDAKGALKDADAALAEARKSGDADAVKAAEDARAQVQQSIADAEKSVKEAKDKAALARARAKDPETPQTDDEKKAVQEANDEELAQAKRELESSKAVAAAFETEVKKMREETAKTFALFPEANLKIVRARYDKLTQAMGIADATPK
jgi:hypothetical protein